MRSSWKRLVAVFLVAAMLFTMAPSSVALAGPRNGRGGRGGHNSWWWSYTEETEAPETEAVVETEEVETVIETVVEEETEAVVTETEAEASETEVAETDVVSVPEVITVSGKTAKVYVDVEYDEGVLPEGTEMVVKDVDADTYMDQVNEVVEGNVSEMAAVDITFSYEGQEIQPDGDIKVSLALRSDLGEADNYSVVHIKEDAETDETVVEVVEDDAIVTEADETGAVFMAGSFSVYAVVAADDNKVTYFHTYHFLQEIGDDGLAEDYQFLNKAGKMVSTQIIKNGEKLETVPGPATDLTRPFSGWYIATKGDDGKYTLTDEMLDFDQAIVVGDEDKDIYLAPAYDRSIIATFYDKAQGSSPINIVTKRVVSVVNGTATIPVDDISVPTGATETLSGWTMNGTDYPLSEYTSITAAENVDLYPIFTTGHWLRFVGGESGSNAEYVPAIFVTEDTPDSDLSTLTPSTREGFTFAGWYEGSQDVVTGAISYGSQVTNAQGSVLDLSALRNKLRSGDVTLYGKWTGKTANYRVAIWYENPDDDGFSLHEYKETNSGTAGTTTNVTAGNVAGFTAQPIQQQVIKGNGSTLVNVYYKRNIYEVKFYKVRSGNWGSVSPGNEIPSLKITAKYGADIHDQWPGTKAGTGEYGAAWYVDTNFSEYRISITTMPLNGADYYQKTSGDYAYKQVFMVQSVNGGNNFETYIEVPYRGQYGVYKTAGDYTHIDGFKINAYSAQDKNAIISSDTGDKEAVYEPSFKRSVQIGSYYLTGSTTEPQSGYWGGNNYQEPIDGYYTLYFYYLRNQYSVFFEENGGEAVDDLTGIYYEANIADVRKSQIAALNEQYVIDQTTKTVSGEGDYVFKGWYDNEACLGDTYNFDQKMPAANVTLYAKWEPIEYLIQIDPNGGEIYADGEMTYTWMHYNDTLHAYNIQRNYVEDPNGEYQYYNVKYPGNDEDTLVSSQRKAAYVTDTSVLTEGQRAFLESGKKYKPATSVDYYAFVGWYNTTTGKVFDFSEHNVKGPISIQAKWRRSGTFDIWYQPVAVTDGVQVSGDVTSSQDKGYADLAVTNISENPVNIHGEDGKNYVFKGWQIVDNFTDCTPLSETLYKQGDEFTIDASMSTDHVIHMLAVYEKAEDSHEPVSVTNLIFDANGGTGEQKVYEGLQLNAQFDLKDADGFFTRTGYKLAGWSQNKDAQPGDTDVFATDMIIGVDNLDPMEEITEGGQTVRKNILYAIWEETEYYYIFHSANGKLEAVEMPEDASETVDLTEKVPGGFLYGGYYSAFGGYTVTADDKAAAVAAADGIYAVSTTTYPTAVYNADKTYVKGLTKWWKNDQALIADGSQLKPVKDTVYYIKEVPDKYLTTRIQYVYDWSKENRLNSIYLLTVVDDKLYTRVCFDLKIEGTTEKTATLAGAFTFVQKNTENKKTTSVTDFADVKRGFIGYADGGFDVDGGGFIAADTVFTITPRWVTPDGVTVAGKGRTFTTGATGTSDSIAEVTD